MLFKFFGWDWGLNTYLQSRCSYCLSHTPCPAHSLKWTQDKGGHSQRTESRITFIFCFTQVSFPQNFYKEENAKALKEHEGGHWWLTSVIPATQEAEIRRITVGGQPRQIVLEILPRKYPTQKKGWRSGSTTVSFLFLPGHRCHSHFPGSPCDTATCLPLPPPPLLFSDFVPLSLEQGDKAEEIAEHCPGQGVRDH
jgi:hypothetical protein